MKDLKFVSNDILVSFLRQFSKFQKICFIYNVSEKTASMVKIKTLKYCENFLRVSNEQKQSSGGVL